MDREFLASVKVLEKANVTRRRTTRMATLRGISMVMKCGCDPSELGIAAQTLTIIITPGRVIYQYDTISIEQ